MVIMMEKFVRAIRLSAILLSLVVLNLQLAVALIVH